uniref:Uncharacterized protein n=1 Tax=Rhizophora mucronata TaxID=61149 RepID=A0A2P2PGK6_RHIMU
MLCSCTSNENKMHLIILWKLNFHFLFI